VLPLLALAAAIAAPVHGAPADGVLLGRSWQGREIRAYERGDPRSPHRVLVVGCIHGNECAALPAIRRLLGSAPTGIDLWLVPTLNPDGYVRGTRVNAHGVDLNRNWGAGWRPYGRAFDLEYPGRGPWSERESRIGRELILRVRPEITIWFHQPQTIVRAWGGSVPLARRYAALCACGLPFRLLPWLSGSATNWQNHRFPGTTSFVVELAPGRLAAANVARHVHAVLSLVP
jgi:protein MpaA